MRGETPKLLRELRENRDQAAFFYLDGYEDRDLDLTPEQQRAVKERLQFKWRRYFDRHIAPTIDALEKRVIRRRSTD